jgi:hypothetical protein
MMKTIEHELKDVLGAKTQPCPLPVLTADLIAVLISSTPFRQAEGTFAPPRP